MSRPSHLPLEGVTLCPMGSSGSDRHMRPDVSIDDRNMSFHLPSYAGDYSYSHAYHEEYCHKAEVPEDSGGRSALTERHPSFESLELGFTELLPPMYPRVPQPLSPSPSHSPWLDSPYLSSSPSPSHSLSPYPASSPISSSPLPPLSHSSYPQCSQEMCSSPPSNTGHYQELCPPPYSQYESWEQQMRPSCERDGLKLDGQPDFTGPSPMQHITLEEGRCH